MLSFQVNNLPFYSENPTPFFFRMMLKPYNYNSFHSFRN